MHNLQRLGHVDLALYSCARKAASVRAVSVIWITHTPDELLPGLSSKLIRLALHGDERGLIDDHLTGVIVEDTGDGHVRAPASLEVCAGRVMTCKVSPHVVFEKHC